MSIRCSVCHQETASPYYPGRKPVCHGCIQSYIPRVMRETSDKYKREPEEQTIWDISDEGFYEEQATKPKRKKK